MMDTKHPEDDILSMMGDTGIYRDDGIADTLGAVG